jgi:hypothetical protein
MNHEWDWIIRAVRQFGWVGLRSKRPRRRVPYGDELLLRAASAGVNFGRIKGRRRS